MTSDQNEAKDSFLGYLYQLRFGLLRALRTNSGDVQLAFELLDDIQLAEDPRNADERTGVSLHQLKHSVTQKASLGARSLIVWKTIGNWARLIAANEIVIEDCEFYLHTTATATTQSPCYYLRHDKNRRPDKARRLLVEEGAKSADTKVTQCHQWMLALPTKSQEALFERIFLVDSEVHIGALRGELEVELSVACHPTHLTSHVRQLEGWLFDFAINSLLPGGVRRIPVAAIKAESARIRDTFVADSLPDEFSYSPVPSSAITDADDRLFVKQLQLVRASGSRITAAQQDHFRAFAQRSQWAREGLVAINELPRFDASLIDEWKRRHDDMCGACASDDDADKAAAGLSLYRWAELDAPNLVRLQLRSAFNAAFLIRGSFHVLAEIGRAHV